MDRRTKIAKTYAKYEIFMDHVGFETFLHWIYVNSITTKKQPLAIDDWLDGPWHAVENKAVNKELEYVKEM